MQANDARRTSAAAERGSGAAQRVGGGGGGGAVDEERVVLVASSKQQGMQAIGIFQGYFGGRGNDQRLGVAQVEDSGSLRFPRTRHLQKNSSSQEFPLGQG